MPEKARFHPMAGQTLVDRYRYMALLATGLDPALGLDSALIDVYRAIAGLLGIGQRDIYDLLADRGHLDPEQMEDILAMMVPRDTDLDLRYLVLCDLAVLHACVSTDEPFAREARGRIASHLHVTDRFEDAVMNAMIRIRQGERGPLIGLMANHYRMAGPVVARYLTQIARRLTHHERDTSDLLYEEDRDLYFDARSGNLWHATPVKIGTLFHSWNDHQVEIANLIAVLDAYCSQRFAELDVRWKPVTRAAYLASILAASSKSSSQELVFIDEERIETLDGTAIIPSSMHTDSWQSKLIGKESNTRSDACVFIRADLK